MALKSAWAYRNGKREMKECKETTGKLERAKREALSPTLRKKREVLKKISEERFETLIPGDTLKAFGMPHIVIKKKNKKSIITSNGNKFSKAELI